VLLQFVDPSALFGNEDTSLTPLHRLAYLADPIDYSTHENQLILAKQLIEHGANVNAVSSPDGKTPLHDSCHGNAVTNLDFVEYLLEAGADPNFQDDVGATPLMCTAPDAPGAAKFLLNWPATDVNITTLSGFPFLADVRMVVEEFSDKVALPDNPDRVQHEFVLRQWRAILEMLVERGAHDIDITCHE
jgi:ankyrin repeat protein